MPSRSRSSSRHNSRSKSRSKSRSRTPDSRKSRTPDSRKSRTPERRSSRRSRSPDSRERRRSPGSRGGGGRRTGNRENPDAGNVLGVFGLSLYTSEKDLEKEFGQFGPIEKVQVVLDGHSGRSRGFAFINFESTDDAVEARSKMTGSEMDGRKIRVDFSVTKRPHTPTPGMYMGRPTGGRSGYGRDDDRRDRGRGYGRDDDRGGRSHDRRRSPSYDRRDRRRSPSPYRRRSPSPYSRSSRRSRSRSPRY